MEILKQIMLDAHTEKRELTFTTGQAGMQLYNVNIQKASDRDFADFLKNQNLITVEERDSLHKMINSTEEDHTVARVIMENKSEILFKKH